MRTQTELVTAIDSRYLMSLQMVMSCSLPQRGHVIQTFGCGRSPLPKVRVYVGTNPNGVASLFCSSTLFYTTPLGLVLSYWLSQGSRYAAKPWAGLRSPVGARENQIRSIASSRFGCDTATPSLCTHFPDEPYFSCGDGRKKTDCHSEAQRGCTSFK